MKPMIYLASPHSHPDKEVRQRRYEMALLALQILLRNGKHVFSPIVHSHNLGPIFRETPDFDDWSEFDFNMMSRCDNLWVLTIPGWSESKGVREEWKFWRSEKDTVIRQVKFSFCSYCTNGYISFMGGVPSECTKCNGKYQSLQLCEWNGDVLEEFK